MTCLVRGGRGAKWSLLSGLDEMALSWMALGSRNAFVFRPSMRPQQNPFSGPVHTLILFNTHDNALQSTITITADVNQDGLDTLKRLWPERNLPW